MKTSFGSLDILLKSKGKTIAELGTFKKEGRSHSHKEWEICYTISGKGYIVVKNKKHKVKSGVVTSIPPRTEHWMIPKGKGLLKILIVYSNRK